MATQGKAPGCFKYGCVGCLSLLALGVGLTFLITVVHFASGPREPEPVERRAEHPLPAFAGKPQLDAPSFPEVLPLPELDGAPAEDPPAGRVVLDLKMGDFILRSGPADQPIRIDADFDAGAFELSEKFTPSEGSGWTYEVSFGSRRGFLGMIRIDGLGGNLDVNSAIEMDRGWFTRNFSHCLMFWPAAVER